MAQHDALYPLILAETPGCPLPMVRTAINRAAADFCTNSLAWQADLSVIPVTAGVAQYSLLLPDDADLVVIREGAARLSGRKLKSLDYSLIVPGVTGLPTHIAQASYGAVVLYPEPTDSAVLTIRATLKPTITALSLPEDLVSRYHEAISEGAKAILKRMPNQPWSDPQGAATAYALHTKRTAEARISVEMGRMGGSMQMKPRAYGRP